MIEESSQIQPMTMLSLQQSFHGRQQDQRIWCIDWHPNGQMLATGGSGKRVFLWKFISEQWKFDSVVKGEHSKTIRCIRFSADGSLLASCSFDATISIAVFSEGGYQQLATLQGHQHEVKCISWQYQCLTSLHPKLVSCSRDKNVWIWQFNPTTYEYECDNVLQGHSEDVKYVQWINSDEIVSCSYDNTVRVWKQDEEEEWGVDVLDGHTSTVWSIAYDRQTDRLFSAGDDGRVFCWKRNPHGRFQFEYYILEIHAYPIYTIALLSSSLLMTGSGDNSVAIISTHGSTQGSLQNQSNSSLSHVIARQYHNGDVNCLRSYKINEKQWRVASVSDDRMIKVWKVLQK